MENKPKKILEISGKDWMGGISLQSGIRVGGIFQTAIDFDPFNRMGFLQPSKSTTQYGSAQITKTIKYMAGIDIAGPFIIGYAEGGGATHLYKTNATSGATTDESASITSSANARGLLFARNRLLYALPTTIRSVAAALTGDAEILTGLTDGEHPMVVGADLNIYGIDGGTAANNIFRIVLATAATGNVISVFSLEPGMLIRDIKNTGRHLVMIADNRNSSSSGAGTYNCVVAYWDYSSGTLSQRFDFRDSAMNACVQQPDGNILVIGGDRLYLTNISTPPTPVFSFTGNSTIATRQVTTPAKVIVRDGIVLWADTNGGTINAYGSLVGGQEKILFRPHTLANVTALVENFGQLWASTSTPALYGFWEGSTLATSTVSTSNISLDGTYSYAFARVVARSVLASGASVTVKIYSRAGGGLITDQATFSFSADGTKQSKIISRVPGTVSTDAMVFNEIEKIEITTNVALQSVELWGQEVSQPNQIV